MPMWHDLEEMGQRQKNGGKKKMMMVMVST
jgi:hypothetical protein